MRPFSHYDGQFPAQGSARNATLYLDNVEARVVRPDRYGDGGCVIEPYAECRGVDLSQTDLGKANLSGADLAGAKLHGTNLAGAILTDANLSGASYCATVPPDGSVSNLAYRGTAQSITILNRLAASGPCPGGNTVTVFNPTQQLPIPPGGSLTFQGNFSSFPGLGLQVDNGYWTQTRLDTQKGPPQNPDNSGAQFVINDPCGLNASKAVFGQGIQTYLIASVTARKAVNGCTITISPNAYTDAVTPVCCAPPLDGFGNVCTNQ